MSIRHGIVTLVASVVMIATSAHAQEFPHADLAKQVLDDHIRPTYQSLATSFNKLRVATKMACSDGTADSDELDRVDDAYRSAVLEWAKASHLRFGPINEKNQYERVVFWPDRKGRGRKQVKRLLRSGAKSKKKTFDATTLSRKSVAVQGLTAFEVLLYGTRVNSSRVRTLDRFACSYGTAIANNLASIAASVRAAWKDGGYWARLWSSPGSNNPVYLSQIEVTREFANAFLHGLQELRDRHLIAPLGFVKGRMGRVYRPLFAASGLSTTYLRGGLIGLSNMFDAGGLAKALRTYDELQTNSVEWQFAEALKAAKEVDATPTADLRTEPVRGAAVAMGFPMKSINIYVSEMLGRHASLSLGFNASDGD